MNKLNLGLCTHSNNPFWFCVIISGICTRYHYIPLYQYTGHRGYIYIDTIILLYWTQRIYIHRYHYTNGHRGYRYIDTIIPIWIQRIYIHRYHYTNILDTEDTDS